MRQRFWGCRRAQEHPADIIATLNKELNAGLADSKIRARIVELAAPCWGLSRGVRDDHLGCHRKVGEGDQVRGIKVDRAGSPLDSKFFPFREPSSPMPDLVIS